MLAIVVSRPGGPEVLELRQRPAPACGPDELLVGIRASAVNRADLLQRRGLYPAPPGVAADIPGLEFAGEILACGAAVSGWRPGERVMAIAGGGAYAETIAIAASNCMPVPPGLSWEQAAAVPEAFLTAYDALTLRGRLASGETLLISAAASGVGTAAIQLATLLGARVVALARSEAKRARLSALGAAAVIDPAADGLTPAILAATGAHGIDVVIDLVGAALWPLYLEVLAPLGRVVVVGTLSGARIELDLGTLMRRRASVVGTLLRARSTAEKAALSAAFVREMLPHLASGKLSPVIHAVLPLAQAPEAHRILEANQNFGKVVLSVAPGR